MIEFDALVRANAPLNAFTDFDGSAEGGGGALAGLTVGVKANIAVAGMPWTAGCEVYRGRVAPKDAAVVTKLRAAGAAIIGMLNMEEAALGAKTDNPWFGKTQNPHKTGYTPGGSSGGSGSAVAAGLCDIALGTDTMGSVRIPAAYCGVYGFKPAQTSVSQEGLELAEEWLDCIGPLARSLDLLESAARVMTDFGDGDAASGPLVTLAETGVDCELEVIEKFRDVIRLAGSEIAVAQLAHPLSRIRFSGFIKTSKAMAAHFADAGQDKLSANLKKLLTYGPKRSDADWAEDQAILAETAQAVQDIVAKHAAIILPTAPQGAFSHSEDAPANQADYTCLANIANLPAMGVDDAGMPLGLQIVGRTGHEADLFQLAREFDAKLQAYRRPDHFLAK